MICEQEMPRPVTVLDTNEFVVERCIKDEGHEDRHIALVVVTWEDEGA